MSDIARPRILAHMVTRNEAGRYLQAVLAALGPHTTDVHVYDDRSTDDTVAVAAEAGATISLRSRATPSFADHEGFFRQAAWEAFVLALAPSEGDWVLCADADELLVAPNGLSLPSPPALAVVVPIPEAWELSPLDGRTARARVRTDGWWNRLSAPRLFAYRPGATFAPHPLACGAVPVQVTEGERSWDAGGAALLHLGYVDPDDRRIKHHRYSTVPGHAPIHVASILTEPVLADWPGEVRVWRGRR